MSRKERLYHALSQELMPEQLTIEDESHLHHVPKNAESHFKIIAVSKCFIPLSRVARHRLMMSLVSQEFQNGLHALSLHLFTPDEWIRKEANDLSSPLCLGGKHKET